MLVLSHSDHDYVRCGANTGALVIVTVSVPVTGSRAGEKGSGSGSGGETTTAATIGGMNFMIDSSGSLSVSVEDATTSRALARVSS